MKAKRWMTLGFGAVLAMNSALGCNGSASSQGSGGAGSATAQSTGTPTSSTTSSSTTGQSTGTSMDPPKTPTAVAYRWGDIHPGDPTDPETVDLVVADDVIS